MSLCHILSVADGVWKINLSTWLILIISFYFQGAICSFDLILERISEVFFPPDTECCSRLSYFNNCCIAMNTIHTYACWNIMTQWWRVTQFFRKIYLSLYWKGCVWEGVGDWTELQHIDPHSYGYNSISFPFSRAAELGAWEPSLSRCWFSLPHLFLQLIWSPTDFLSSPRLYNNLMPTLLPASITNSQSFNPSMVKVIISWYSSIGWTCYLHRCISYFDSPAGSEVNIQHNGVYLMQY